jgi:transposase
MRHHQITIRAQALALVTLANMPVATVAEMTGISRQHIYILIKNAKQRGFNPTVDPRILEEYVIDAPRSGRPKEISPLVEQAIIETVTKDRAGREKSSEYLAYEAGISQSSTLRILKRSGLSKTKPTWKPGLTDAAKKRRLQFCLDHADWTLEDWKNVIWTDQTSIVLGHRRGAIRVWRTQDEATDPSCVRRRWKGVTEFMFWGSFSYDKKGPCHIWLPETSQSKKNAETELTIINREREADCKAAWELETAMRRMQLRSRSGRKPQWRFTAKTGKLIRSGKGGIDWYRYQKVV